MVNIGEAITTLNNNVGGAFSSAETLIIYITFFVLFIFIQVVFFGQFLVIILAVKGLKNVIDFLVGKKKEVLKNV